MISQKRRYETVLYIFRRDLRLHDNTGLNAALGDAKHVLASFIFDPAQIQPHPYQSKPGLQFMLQALAELRHELQAIGSSLALYHASPSDVLRQIVAEHAIQAVYINRDYTPFSRLRDQALVQVCSELQLALHIVGDYLLTEPEQALKHDRTPYKVFTAFYNRARQIPVAIPQAMGTGQLLNVTTPDHIRQLGVTIPAPNLPPFLGGRTSALKLLKHLSNQQNYLDTRDFPALDATSHLSVHLKFGTCSIREAFYSIYSQLGESHPLLRQLYWRDFFTHIAYHFPQVFSGAFDQRFQGIQWDDEHGKAFQSWSTGMTGFPIVDAGMRELNATGFMHNRVRMIVASFLVKDLHINWQVGERYFAQHLVDYDPCVNNGNWQWAASTGCDAQPYFRIFNPWLQQQKFDPDCQYIYRWLPEVQNIPATVLHQWSKRHHACGYPAPILEHASSSQIIKQRYKEAAQAFIV